MTLAAPRGLRAFKYSWMEIKSFVARRLKRTLIERRSASRTIASTPHSPSDPDQGQQDLHESRPLLQRSIRKSRSAAPRSRAPLRQALPGPFQASWLLAQEWSSLLGS